MTSAELLPAAILKRTAVVYVRQSTQSQVMTNLESKRRQYDLVDVAHQRGFVDVEVIDDDLGRSASGTVARPGFERLVAWLCAGKVGAVLCFDASRLARNGRDWHHLLELCGLVEAQQYVKVEAGHQATATYCSPDRTEPFTKPHMSRRRVVITGLGSSRRWARPPTRCGTSMSPARAASARSPGGTSAATPCALGANATNFDLTKLRRRSIDEAKRHRPLRRSSAWRPRSPPSKTPASISTRKTATAAVSSSAAESAASKRSKSRTRSSISRGVSRVSPFTVPRLMVNAASGNVSIHLPHPRPQHRRRHRLRHRLECHRRCGAVHPARPGRRDDRRRQRSRAVRAWAWPASSPPGRFPPATMIPPMPAGPGTRTATGSSWAKGPGVVILEEYRTREKARRAHLRRTGRLRHERRRISHHRSRPERPRRRPVRCDWH